MKIDVVMKFGGTSVGNAQAILATAEHVIREPRPKMVVLSAVGGVTDLLIRASQLACSRGARGPVVREINRRHREILQNLELETNLLSEWEDELEHLMQGIALLRELTPRIQDAVVSLGERMSVRLMAAVLCQKGHPAKAYNSWELGFLTDPHFGKAEPLPESYSEIARVCESLAGSEVPVVTGYIGKNVEGDVTTLGRGGSDFSAAIFGAALGVQEIQIWTDVPGIMRADPRVVTNPEVIPEIRFEEAAELAYFGAKVLHPRTIEPARQRGIPVRVLGTFHVDPKSELPISKQGTLIHDQAPAEPVRALAVRNQVQSLYIHSLRMLEAPGFLSRVFEILARHQISVDVIATSEVSISMTFDRTEGNLEAAVSEISKFAEVEALSNRSILCLVGDGLRQDAKLLSEIFRILGNRQIPVHVISQGASQINVTLVTDPSCVNQAMTALYQELFN